MIEYERETYKRRLTQLHADVNAWRRWFVLACVAGVFALIIGFLAGFAAASEESVAFAHRETLPVESRAYVYYVTTEAAPADFRDELFAVTSYMMASASRQQVIERCTPIRLTNTLGWFDLRNLKWDVKHWYDFLATNYPYGRWSKSKDYEKGAPLVIRADWLVVALGDASRSDLYYRLLYGDKPPKTRDEFLAFWKVDSDPTFRFGQVEGDSGVAVQKVRWMEFRPIAIPDAFAWGTRDSAEINAETDPLEHLLGDQKHDAEEWIVSMPKVSITTGKRGHLIACFLNAGDGAKQDKAPVNIVEDHTNVRGREIINPVSCYVCHTRGINEPTVNEFERYLRLGAEKYSRDPDESERIELFHLGSLDKTIRRNQEDYETAVIATTGMAPEVIAPGIKRVFVDYDSPVTLDDAARELACEADDLKLAIAYYDTHGGKLSGRLAGLAHGLTMPRTRWESEYFTAWLAVQEWEAAK